jgi:peptide-methionine (S)-S-oxide reductase
MNLAALQLVGTKKSSDCKVGDTMKSLIAGLWGLLVILMANTTVMSATNLEKATFAGGCFWCMEHPFDEIPGVVSVTSGYTGGQKKNPTYEEVSAGGTRHAESVQVAYDPAKVTYEKLL